MQFNIEVSVADNLSIKLQVMKNTISLYFNGQEAPARIAMNKWKHLDSHFLASMSHYNKNWVRGPDAPHIKRNHTNAFETSVIHFHREFYTEITPEIFAFYITNFYTQKKSHSEKYQSLFSVNLETTIEAFKAYYDYYCKEYRWSVDERLFEEEHNLTEDERTLYERAVRWQTGTRKPFSQLASNSIFNKKEPKDVPYTGPLSHKTPVCIFNVYLSPIW
ncbi:MAG: hypothetical protein Q8M03_04920 [Legionella sp.]|nr:hypothetical protein [Legionella sp.]